MPNRPHRRPARSAGRPELTVDPLSVAAAQALGWSPSARRHAINRGDIVRRRRGVVAVPETIDASTPTWQRERDRHLRAARSARVSSPRSSISHVGAALAYDLPALRVPKRPCLTVPAGTALRRVVDAHLHRATLPVDDVVLLGGDVVTSPSRTVMDIAREFGVEAAVVVADAALYSGLTDVRELTGSYEQCRGWPGRKNAAITLRSLDGRAESALESLSRLRLRSERLPAPEPQVRIYDLAGNFLGRCDFYWDEFGVVGEADGDLKYDADGIALGNERTRQTLFERAGLIVVRWGMSDLARFGPTTRQLRDAFSRGAPPGSALRRWVTRSTPLHSAASLTRP